MVASCCWNFGKPFGSCEVLLMAVTLISGFVVACASARDENRCILPKYERRANKK